MDSITETETLEILKTIRSLPSDKVAELRDFAFFLRERYGQQEIIDESNEWSEEDMQEFAAASLRYFEGFVGKRGNIAMKPGTVQDF